MNKKMILLVVFFTAPNLVASHSACFRPYRAEVSNKSGGVAIVQKTSGLSGIARKTEFDPNSAITIMVKKRGAELAVLAGPEDNKSLREIEFYSKEPNMFTAQVTLNPKGVSTSGFYTKNIVYNVKFINESGAIVRINDTCGIKGPERVLADGKSVTLSVQPGAYIMVQSGPENRKVNYRINFADQTGDNPTITFVKRGFMSSGIQHKNLELQAQRISMPRWVRGRVPVQTMQPKRMGMQRNGTRYSKKMYGKNVSMLG
jgi:hypothetical protein